MSHSVADAVLDFARRIDIGVVTRAGGAARQILRVFETLRISFGRLR